MFSSEDSIGTILGEVLVDTIMIIILMLFIKYFPYVDVVYEIIVSGNNIVFLSIGLFLSGVFRVCIEAMYRNYKSSKI